MSQFRSNESVQRPAARAKGLVVRELDGELIIYDQDRDHAHCLNASAAMVFRHCDGKTSPAAIARRMSAELHASVDEAVVWSALDRLSKKQLLVDKLEIPPAITGGMSRREFVRNLSLTALIAIPAISSIVAPTAQAQASQATDHLRCAQIQNKPDCTNAACTWAGPTDNIGACRSSR